MLQVGWYLQPQVPLQVPLQPPWAKGKGSYAVAVGGEIPQSP